MDREAFVAAGERLRQHQSRRYTTACTGRSVRGIIIVTMIHGMKLMIILWMCGRHVAELALQLQGRFVLVVAAPAKSLVQNLLLESLKALYTTTGESKYVS
jgi:hypothetical protein